MKKALIFLIILAVAFNLYILRIQIKYKENIYSDIQNVPERQTALVLGAKVYNNGNLSDIFRDRLDSAIELYENQKVAKILISGDHGRENYDEVNAGKDYLISKGISEKDIFLDHAGFDTYDSIYRARDIFEVDSLIIVTQDFHLPRSLYIARSLDIDAIGYSADRHIYIGAKRMKLREYLATGKAILNVVFNSKPKYLGDKVPITGDSQLSWD